MGGLALIGFMENIEVSICRKCRHAFDSDCTDQGTYSCPKCNKYTLPHNWKRLVQNVVKQMEAKNEIKRKAARD